MKDYIKPSFMFVALEASASGTGGCAISKEEKNDLIDIYGEYAFTIDGKCRTPVEGYCKFTSAEFTDPIKAFGS